MAEDVLDGMRRDDLLSDSDPVLADRPVDADDAFRGRDVSNRRKPRRGRVGGARRLVVVVLVVAVVAGMTAVAYFTPLMSVRSIEVRGQAVVSADRIRAAAAIPNGTPLLQVNTLAAARRVAGIPRIAQVRVKRSYPSTIDISVSERIPVAAVTVNGSRMVLDKSGFLFTLAPGERIAAIPELVTAHPGPSDAATLAAVAVVQAMPDFVRTQVARITADSSVNLRLTLRDNRTVVWGDAENTSAKSSTLRYVLTQPGSEYNVSSPDNPVVR